MWILLCFSDAENNLLHQGKSRCAVEDTIFEAKAKDSKKKKIRGQGPTF